MANYSIRTVRITPRLPLQGSLDLTYRCNFNCRHCWLRIPAGAAQRHEELDLSEIKSVVDQTRALGCREWSISGGEPLLRPDFPEIFDYLTSKTAHYSLNTNGSLITPAIARQLRRKGRKMVALYAATAEVHNRVTRTPGGFEQTRRGMAYLKEAGAGFIVQLIPMRANYHQWADMVALAQRLSPQWRVGAAWLYLSADGTPARNAEITAQRLAPEEMVVLDQPDFSYEERMEEMDAAGACGASAGSGEAPDDRLFARCIANRNSFHIDPYGKMSFCSYIKGPSLRYDLRQGSFREAWEDFIPALSDIVRGGEEYRAHCGACEKSTDCRWCAAYAYLETGRYGAPIPFLCAAADAVQRFREQWHKKHRRYFQIAGITVRVESDLDFEKVSFKPELERFAAAGPGDDNVTLRHYFELPKLNGKDLGRELYRKAPWAISRKNDTWYYLGISPEADDPDLHRVGVFSSAHTHARIYSPPRDERRVRDEGFQSLSLFPTDQIWLAPLLADRQAVLLHSAGVILNGQGLVFVGHSDAGKSTTVTMLKSLPEAAGNGHVTVEVLCDDRNIVRRWDDGWRVHGTWSHGDVPDVSPASAPLRAILFLQQAVVSEIVPLKDRKDIWVRLLATLIRPMVTAEWWHKELQVLERLVAEAPCYLMRFDKSGDILPALLDLAVAPGGRQ